VWRRGKGSVVRRGGDEEMKMRFVGEFFFTYPFPLQCVCQNLANSGGLVSTYRDFCFFPPSPTLTASGQPDAMWDGFQRASMHQRAQVGNYNRKGPIN